MQFNNIKIGERLEISEKDVVNNIVTYISQVENILDKNKLLIHMPIFYGQLIRLELKTKYSVLFFTEKGMLRFDASVIKRTIEDGFNLLVIQIESDGIRIQRREFFRFTCIIETNFVTNQKSADPDFQEITSFSGIIKDIGGGGIRFISNQNLDEDCKIKSMIVLGNDLIPAVGRILQKQYLPKSDFKFQYRAEFIGMQKQEQEKIVQYIFEQQRKILQRTKV